MPGTSLFWLDGARAESLPLPDRGLDYGDGLFETLLLRSGRPLYSQLHLSRLERGLHALAFPDCLTRAGDCLAQAAADVAARGWQWTALRLTLTRGSGPRGYAAPEAATPRILVSATPLQRDCAQLCDAARLGETGLRLAAQPQLAGIKHLNRLEQVLAASEGRRQQVEEVLLMDQADRLVSLAAGNLFLRHGEVLSTPALTDCGIAGTRRQRLIEHWAPTLGLQVRETALDLADLLRADEVFYSNALYGLRPVAAFRDQHWSGHRLCRALFANYLEDAQ